MNAKSTRVYIDSHIHQGWTMSQSVQGKKFCIYVNFHGKLLKRGLKSHDFGPHLQTPNQFQSSV